MNKARNQSWVLNKSQEMKYFSKNFIAKLTLPSIILLEGELGSGKTTFTQHFCRVFGVKETVTSPTFNLLNTYEVNAIKFYHIDLYRLKLNQQPQLEELVDFQGDEYCCLIEWPNIFDIDWNELSEQMGAKLYHLFFQYGNHETQRIISYK